MVIRSGATEEDMVTLFITQAFRPSKFAQGEFVRGRSQQFGTLGEALTQARNLAGAGCRAEVYRVTGDPVSDLWDEPRLLKRVFPLAVMEERADGHGAAPDQAIESLVGPKEEGHQSRDARHYQIQRQDGLFVTRH